MVRVPDASGVLTGKVNKDTVFDKNDHRSTEEERMDRSSPSENRAHKTNRRFVWLDNH